MPLDSTIVEDAQEIDCVSSFDDNYQMAPMQTEDNTTVYEV